MPRVLVIGFGNRLRGDDGFGPLAAELIAGRHPPGVEVIVTHQLGPELAPALNDADRVVFLDAEMAGEPGLLKAAAVELRDLPASLHHLEPGSLLALTRAVYGKAPEATLVTATAVNFEHGDEISAELRAAANMAADAVERLADGGRLDAEALRAAFSEPV